MTNRPDETLPVSGGNDTTRCPAPADASVLTPPGDSKAPYQAHQPAPAQTAALTPASIASTLVGSALFGMPKPAVPVQDLSGDKLLLAASCVMLQGTTYPALGGIPLLAKLGQGGMGAVYYGIHPRLKVEVAVKVLPFHLATQQHGLVERFFREAQIAAKVQSPHLVNVLDVNEDQGLFYLVMEYVHGTSAGSYLKDVKKTGAKGLPEAEALDIVLAANQGLLAAHSQGVIHRDIKPDNIMVPRGKDGVLAFERAKLADLGLARGEDTAQSLTGQHAALGTPGYMAPEQAEDARSAGKPADVFSMGAALYALMGGHAPFTGSSLMQIFMATAQKPHEPIAALRPEITPATAALIDRCLSKDPAARPNDALALMSELQVCRKGLGAEGGSGFAATVVGLRGITKLAPKKQEAPRAPARKRRWPWALGAAALLLFAAYMAGKVTENAQRARAAAEESVFGDERDALAARLALAKLGDEDAARKALEALGEFRGRHEARPDADFAALAELEDALHARVKDLETRRATFQALVDDAKDLIATDAGQALEKLAEAQRVGAPDEAKGFPDLSANLSPGLGELRTRASASAARRTQETQAQSAAEARRAFETAYAAAQDLFERREYATAQTTAEKALAALGELDHPAREAAAKLAADARSEGLKKEQFQRDLLDGQRLHKSGKFAEAIEAFRKARTVWPQAPDIEKAIQGMADAEQMIKRAGYEQALAAGREALQAGNWTEAETQFGRALHERPGDINAKKGLADAAAGARDERYRSAEARGRRALEAQNWSAAEAAYRQALGENSTPEAQHGLQAAQDGARDEKVAALLDRARDLGQAREFEKCEECLRQVLHLKPGEPTALRGLNLINGIQALQEQNFDHAEEYFNRVLASDPDDATADAARKGLKMSGEARERVYSEKMAQANVHLRAGDRPAAKAAAEDALRAKPGDEAARALILRAAQPAERAQAPSIKFTRELGAKFFKGAKINGQAAKLGEEANPMSPGRNQIEVTIGQVLTRESSIEVIRYNFKAGHKYELRLNTTRRGRQHVYELKLYEDDRAVAY